MNAIKFAVGFAVGLTIYHKFLSGSPAIETADDGSDSASQGDEE